MYTCSSISYIQWRIRALNAIMACVIPRLDPTLAYPVPLRPSVFQHARFIDKMQPGATRVKQEKYDIFQEEPLKDGMWTQKVVALLEFFVLCAGSRIEGLPLFMPDWNTRKFQNWERESKTAVDQNHEPFCFWKFCKRVPNAHEWKFKSQTTVFKIQFLEQYHFWLNYHINGLPLLQILMIITNERLTQPIQNVL